MSKRHLVIILIVAGVVGLWVIALALMSLKPTQPSRAGLTAEQTDAIQKALKAKGYPAPTLTVTDGGFLVATFELPGPPPPSLRAYAEGALLTIRNTMLPFHTFQNYRVTLNGPSPGPGLVRRYGVARFIEGGSVKWEPAE